MKKIWIVLAVIAVIGFMAFSWYQSGFNTMIALNEQVKSSWAQVENQLQRRFDLIPNLVNTVKGYAEHEKNLLTEVTRLRSQWAQAASVPEKVEAANALTGALSKLLMVSESYPNLKADQTFLKLMDELAGTENRIAVERMRYNESVKEFNITVRRFPANIVAGMFGYKPASEYFKAEEKAKTVPEVKF